MPPQRTFCIGYFLPLKAPMSITGTGLQDFANTCTGKITYLESYNT